MSKKTLIIVESPSKCKTIQNILGPQYKCIASKGHIMEINTRKFDINTWNTDDIHYKQITRQKKTIEMMRKEINQTHDIILATDCDREGETIAWHICLLFHLNIHTTKRIRFQEITPTSILQAVRNPSIIHIHTVDAQKTRQLLDLAIGYTFSPLLWKYIGVYSKQSLSAGRCQTPALKLIYDHYLKERDYYNSEKSSTSYLQYSIESTFHIHMDNMDTPSLDKYKNTNNKIVGKMKTNIKDKQHVIEFLKESKYFHHKIVSWNKTQRENPSKTPLITTSLQRLASKALGLSPKQTMKCAQSLYEKGYITYMRTDQAKYSDTFLKDITHFITDKYGEKYLKQFLQSNTIIESKHDNKKKKINNGNGKQKTQDAHEAIRPTNIHVASAMTGNEQRLYQCIRRHTLQSCMLSPKFDCIHIDISAPFDHLYSCKKEKIFFKGYYIISETNYRQDDNHNMNNNDDDVSYEHLNELCNQLHDIKTLSFSRINTNTEPHFIEFKKRYNDSSLILELEKKGIGRPSTFTNIIDTLLKRNYIIKRNMESMEIMVTSFSLQSNDSEIVYENKNLIVFEQFNRLCLTNLGYVVCKFLYDFECRSLFEYEYTGTLENELDEIARGDTNMNTTLSNTYEFIKRHSVDKKNITKFEIDLDKENQYSFLFLNTGECIRKKGTKDTFRINTEKMNMDTYLKHSFQIQHGNEKYNEDGFYIDIHDLLTKTQQQSTNNLMTISNVDTNVDTNVDVNVEAKEPYLSLDDHKLETHLDKMNPVYANKFIGNHPTTNGKLYIRYGRYGYYLQYVYQKEKICYSLYSKDNNVDTDQIIKNMIEDISYTIHFISNYSHWKATITNNDVNTNTRKNNSKDLCIMVTKHASIRKSKYGRYLYYKTEIMSKPSFLSLKKMKKDADIDMNKITTENVNQYVSSIIEWVKTIHQIDISKE